MTESPTKEKSYAFALDIIKLVKQVQRDEKEYVLSKQLLRSGTSIGANVEEATAGQSKKDFTAKMSIASKEARETRYWLRLLRDSNQIETTTADAMIEKCNELVRLLTSIVKTSQNNDNS